MQLYVKQPNASVPVPNVRLGDFSRVAVAKGKTVTVSLQLTPDYRAIVPNGMCWRAVAINGVFPPVACNDVFLPCCILAFLQTCCVGTYRTTIELQTERVDSNVQ